MNIYVRMIKPIHIYPDSHCIPVSEDLEDSWYPEDEAEKLKKKYKHLNGHWGGVSFRERYVALPESIMPSGVHRLKLEVANEKPKWLDEEKKGD